MRVGVREWKNSYLELALEPHKLNYSLSQTRTYNSNLKRAKPFAAEAHKHGEGVSVVLQEISLRLRELWYNNVSKKDINANNF